jgi:hypothetical protein
MMSGISDAPACRIRKTCDWVLRPAPDRGEPGRSYIGMANPNQLSRSVNVTESWITMPLSR